jgi:hypothetical protein
MQPGDWVFILTEDTTAMLAVHVIARLGLGLNVVTGLTMTGNSQVTRPHPLWLSMYPRHNGLVVDNSFSRTTH